MFLYILMGIVVVGFAALLFYKIKWSRADKKAERKRTDKIEDERVEEEKNRGGKDQKVG
jgi:hypothetical protein